MSRFVFTLVLGVLLFHVPSSNWAQETSSLGEIAQEPEPGSDLVSDPLPEVRGNQYTHPVYNFGLKLPTEDWKFVVDPQAINDFNPDALLVLTAPSFDLYSMVIVEKFPEASIENYAERVKPTLESLERESVSSLTIDGLPAYRQVWEGAYDGVPMRFHYTLIAKEEFRFQIVSWCAKSSWSYGVDNQFDSIGLGFTDLGPVVLPKEPQWTPPPIIGPSDVYSNNRSNFSIARPSNHWTFVTDREEVDMINPDATMAVHRDEEIFSMVIIETLPELSLSEFTGRVSPSLEDAALLGEEETTIHGLAARKRHWRGKFDDIRFDFFYTLIANGDDRIQIVSWCPTSMINDNFRNQIRYIEESFEPLVVPSPDADSTPPSVD